MYIMKTSTTRIPDVGEVWMVKSRIGSDYQKGSSRRYLLIASNGYSWIQDCGWNESEFGRLEGGCIGPQPGIEKMSNTLLEWSFYADNLKEFAKKRFAEYTEEKTKELYDNLSRLQIRIKEILHED